MQLYCERNSSYCVVVEDNSMSINLNGSVVIKHTFAHDIGKVLDIFSDLDTEMRVKIYNGKISFVALHDKFTIFIELVNMLDTHADISVGILSDEASIYVRERFGGVTMCKIMQYFYDEYEKKYGIEYDNDDDEEEETN